MLFFFTALLRWPNRTQASGCLVGFKLAGEIPASGLVRQNSCDSTEGFYGELALRDVTRVEVHRLHRTVAVDARNSQRSSGASIVSYISKRMVKRDFSMMACAEVKTKGLPSTRLFTR